TRTPTGTDRHFLVRFPDGFEKSLTAEQLQVLKHFKDRLQGANSRQPDFDLESIVIYRCVMGSQAYGLETGDSDVDFRGIYLELVPRAADFKKPKRQSTYLYIEWGLSRFILGVVVVFTRKIRDISRFLPSRVHTPSALSVRNLSAAATLPRQRSVPPERPLVRQW
ncbi:MAG TPA: nucleotidyltransferase domain-containing protein, partial [Candidatus Angelobacter sp.]|nr:nucleotidyltransferase domain-containing protein [Candidatus Angelobacter sp.]